MKKKYHELLQTVETKRGDYKKALSEFVIIAQPFSPVTLYIEDLPGDGFCFGFEHKEDNFVSEYWLLPVDRFLELISTIEVGTKVDIHTMISLCI